MERGTPVWVLDDQVWLEANVVAVDTEHQQVTCTLLENDCIDEQLIHDGEEIPAEQNASEFRPVLRRKRSSRRNSFRRTIQVELAHVLPRDYSTIYHHVEDLTKLVHLHEAAILHVLRKRFLHGLIYTSTGSILVAMNPFRRLELYTSDLKETYCQDSARQFGNSTRELPPHVYSVADKAFRRMLHPQKDKKNDQTILVSGESGAGKTETTKLIMSYLAYASSVRHRHLLRRAMSVVSEEDGASIHGRVLESNPILEAFGNARTNRNNNSSRFGKFIKLGFSVKGEMLGACIATYLLERVRLVSQGKGERNYHVFYELCRGSDMAERKNLGLDSRSIESFEYLNQSSCFTRLDGVDDADSYRRTRAAMSKIGMKTEEQYSVMRIVASVLHMGNLSFDSIKEGSKFSSSCHSTVQTVCDLLGVDIHQLEQTLCSKEIRVGSEEITVPLKLDQALMTRDAVAKTLYANLFSWLVQRINASIQYREQKGSTQFIGVVDIFGFEIFDENYLEQLCINFANEKLQQLFGKYVFQMEQEEYMSERVAWQFVDYPNNDAVVIMLEAKPMGMFSLLDEQCLIPQGNDEKLANKYYDLVMKQHSKAMSVSALQRVKRKFVVHHYADSVCYSIDGFCEKNKDHMHTEALELMKTSNFAFLQELFDAHEKEASLKKSFASSLPSPEKTNSGPRRRSGIMSSTVVSQFKTQLLELLEVIKSTEPHFIRCIKPNDDTSPSRFNRRRVLEQLRCSGVLEAVKISRMGYPVRFAHHAFVSSYGCILSCCGGRNGQSQRNMSQKQIAALLVQKLEKTLGIRENVSSDGLPPRPSFQVGTSKVFCTQLAHDSLEQMRSKVLYDSVVVIQRYCMGYVARVRFQNIRTRVIKVQAFVRCAICRCRFLSLMRAKREYHAAVRLQRWAQMLLMQSRFQTMRWASVVVQAHVRGWLVRRHISSASTASLESVLPPPIPVKTQDGKFFSSVHGSLVDSMPLDRDLSEPKTTVSSYDLPTEYSIIWECGLLGLYFESDPDTGMPVVRRVHESLSNCADIFEVSRGDILLAVGKVHVKKGDIRKILSLLQQVKKPVRLSFRRNASSMLRNSTGSLGTLGEEDYEVLWKEGMPLGLGFRPCPDTGLPCVLRSNGNPKLPGMYNVRVGDYLTFINEFSTSGVRFQKVIDILESGPRPAVLRFRHNDQTFEDSRDSDVDRWYMRQSCQNLNPKVDHSLYYITWKEEDGPLGIVVKQESTSFYPRVIKVKDEGAVSRESQRNRVEIGDILLSINNNNISKMGFGAAMRLLQNGPKPLLLMFQRTTLSMSPVNLP